MTSANPQSIRVQRRAVVLLSLLSLCGAAWAFPNDTLPKTPSVSATSDFAEYSEAEPAPTGRLRVSRPVIAWKVTPGKNTQITGVVLRVDNGTVNAAYDVQKQAVWYTPAQAFAPGKHTVSCAVQLNGAAWIDRAWDFTVAPNASATPCAPSANQTAAANAVNAVRARLNLTPVTLDDRLCAAAQSHSVYLTRRSAIAHDEDAASPDFLARDCGGRVAAFGYVGGCFEAIGQGSGDAPAAVARLINAPYHRGAFLQPGTVALGAGVASNTTTFVLGESGADGITTYPAPNQSDVPLAWDGQESPNPLRMHRQAGCGTLGYPISLHLWAANSATETQLSQVRAELFVDQTNKPVPAFVNSPDNDDFLTNTAFLIPQQPLRPATVYRVVINAKTATGEPLRREWRFTTAAK